MEDFLGKDLRADVRGILNKYGDGEWMLYRARSQDLEMDGLESISYDFQDKRTP
jgi:hypothetical protein